MKRYLHITLILLVSVIALTLTCCERHTEAWQKMDLAEILMETQPDSSLVILNGINAESLGGKEESARFALLKSMALDKNYIDTTDFKVLQPAIDYYLKKGTPDEKLRTYYYQGCIYLNRGDDDDAMSTFFKAKEFISESQDTLAITRLLTAQGILYAKQYKYKEYVENSLVCAKLLHSKRMPMFELINLAKALNGSLILNNKNLADSIKACINPIISEVNNGKDYMLPHYLLYTIKFGSKAEIESILDQYPDSSFSNELNLDVAYGYSLIGNGDKASMFINRVDTTDKAISPLKYYSIKSNVLESNALYKDALDAQKAYASNLESFHRDLFSQDLLFAEERHKLEVENIKSIQNKDRIIAMSICALLMFGFLIVYLHYRNRLVETKRKLAEEEISKLELERSSLQMKKEALELSAYNAELTASKKALEADNLKLRISQLESESDTLKELLEKSKLSEPVRLAVKERIDLLNEILAGKVSNCDNYEKPYKDWVASITSDKEKFMRSTQLALRASYPKMFELLESRGLNENEMDYACLYAIGLRGKEIGEYTQNKGHYHLSSQIRKKLGLSDKDTNIGNYIRNLMKGV